MTVLHYKLELFIFLANQGWRAGSSSDRPFGLSFWLSIYVSVLHYYYLSDRAFSLRGYKLKVIVAVKTFVILFVLLILLLLMLQWWTWLFWLWLLDAGEGAGGRDEAWKNIVRHWTYGCLYGHDEDLSGNGECAWICRVVCDANSVWSNLRSYNILCKQLLIELRKM